MKGFLKYLIVPALAMMFAATSCQKDDAQQGLGNDLINRSRIAPYIVGDSIYLVYAMYMPYGTGNLVSATIEASIPGGADTRLEHRAFSTDDTGLDFPVVVGDPCVTEGGATTVNFIVDTCAASLRYYYVIPEEARDRDVYFNCTVVDSHGRRASLTEGPCKVRKMDMFKGIEFTLERCYFSLETMTTYKGNEPGFFRIPVDVVWTYLKKPEDVESGSTFFSPAAIDKIAPYMETPPSPPPAEYMRATDKMRQQIITEKQLANEEYGGLYIDDIDFETLDLQGGTEYMMGVVRRRGFWIETVDGKYRAYIYISLVNETGCEINVKRYKMF